MVLGDYRIVGLADGGQIKCRRIDGEWYGMLPCDVMPKDIEITLLTALSKARHAVGYEKPMKGKRQR